jgi:hypothetical protein
VRAQSAFVPVSAPARAHLAAILPSPSHPCCSRGSLSPLARFPRLQAAPEAEIVLFKHIWVRFARTPRARPRWADERLLSDISVPSFVALHST